MYPDWHRQASTLMLLAGTGLRGVYIRLSRAACASRTPANGSLPAGAVAGASRSSSALNPAPNSSLADRLWPRNRAGIQEVPEQADAPAWLVLPGRRRKTQPPRPPDVPDSPGPARSGPWVNRSTTSPGHAARSSAACGSTRAGRYYDGCHGPGAGPAPTGCDGPLGAQEGGLG